MGRRMDPSSNRGTRKLQISWNSRKTLNSQKSSNSWKKRIVETPGKENPRPTLIYKLDVTSMVWNIAIGQLRLAAWLCSLPAPVHQLNIGDWKIS